MRTGVMESLRAFPAGGVADFGRMGITPEGGWAVRLINKTGAPSVKGSMVSASTTADAFKLQTNEYDSFGAVYEAGKADGEWCWVVVGGIAEVLLENNTAAAPGNWCHQASTDGRADCSLALPGGTAFTEINEHLKEIGHCISTVSAGTNKLAKIILHFL